MAAGPGGDYLPGIRRAGRSVAPSSPSGRRHVTEALLPRALCSGLFFVRRKCAAAGIGRVR
jgi:hypothetical protein